MGKNEVDYKIFQVEGTWVVYSMYIHYGDWLKDKLMYSSDSIADCYAWIKAEQEGLLDT